MPRHPPYTLSSLTTNIQLSLTTRQANLEKSKPANRTAEGESHTWIKPQIQINDIRFIFKSFDKTTTFA